MKFKSATQFTHTQADKVGVLITNLGTPEKPDTPSLRVYLRQFLSDPRVVEVPRIIWWCILNLIILRIRPSRSAKAYKSVWTDEGSPLAIHTNNQAKKLREKIEAKYGDKVIVDWAMRYGNPSIPDAIEKLQQAGARKLFVLPLYPQYSASTTASTFDALAEDFTQRRWIPELRFKTHYCEHPAYVKAVANSIKAHWEKHGKADLLFFSYHGVPLRYLHNGDPYHCQCLKTTRLVAEELGLEKSEYTTAFQSRFGREEWLKPYTDHTLTQLAKDGLKSVQVICPGFSSDCLETIEEIDEENREYFLENGGERFEYIPALNSDDTHIEMIEQIVEEELGGWVESLESEEQIVKRGASAYAAEHNQPKK